MSNGTICFVGLIPTYKVMRMPGKVVRKRDRFVNRATSGLIITSFLYQYELHVSQRQRNRQIDRYGYLESEKDSHCISFMNHFLHQPFPATTNSFINHVLHLPFPQLPFPQLPFPPTTISSRNYFLHQHFLQRPFPPTTISSRNHFLQKLFPLSTISFNDHFLQPFPPSIS